MIDHQGQFLQAFFHIRNVQYFLFFLHRRVDDGRNQIGQRSRFRNGFGHRPELGRQKRGKFQYSIKQRKQIGHQRFCFQILGIVFFNNFDARLLIRLSLDNFFDGKTTDTLQKQLCVIVHRLGHFHNNGTGADLMKIFFLVVIRYLRFVFGHDQTNQTIGCHRFIYQHGCAARHFQRNHRFRKHQHIA